MVIIFCQCVSNKLLLVIGVCCDVYNHVFRDVGLRKNIYGIMVFGWV